MGSGRRERTQEGALRIAEKQYGASSFQQGRLLGEAGRWAKFAHHVCHLGILLYLLCSLFLGTASAQQAQTSSSGGDLLSAVGPVEQQELEGQTVVLIQVKGNRRVEQRSLLTQMRLKQGGAFRANTLSEDLKRVWRLGFFDDLRVDVSPTDGGVIVTYEVTEKPAISEVVFRGNDELSEEDITEVVDVKKFQVLDISKVNANTEKIKNLYVDKGYYLAEVEYDIEIDPASPDSARVVFDIREYAKVQVKKVTFLGNDALSDEELKKVMSTREGDWFSFLTSFGSFKEDAFEADLQRLTAYYYDKGYVQIEVGYPTIRISRDKRYLYITIKLKEGPRFKVGDVDVQGDFLTTKDALMDRVKLETGEYFSYGTLRQDMEAISSIYLNAGYAYANVNPLTQLDPDEKLVHVTYDVQKGSKVYFGRIEVVGNAKTRDKVIRREMVIEEGMLFSKAMIDLSQQRVQRLGFFENVEITTQRADRDDVINVQVRVAERPTGTFQAGAGFSSTENLLANLQISQNNFLGRGQVFSAQVQWSGIRTLFNLQFSDPYVLDTRFRFSTSAYHFDFLYPDYKQQSTGGNVTLGYPLLSNLNGARDLSISTTYKLEEVVITPGGRVSRDARSIGSLFQGGRTSSLSLGLFYDSRDNPFFPTRGQFHSGRVEFADDVLTRSETEFVKTNLETRWYVPLFWQFVLRLNGQLGFITAIDPNKPVPLQERYLVGGPNTVRGFQRFSLGPTRTVSSNSNDPGTVGSEFRLGGDKQLLLTAEVEFPILTAINLKGVFFADAGNAFGAGQGYTLALDLFKDNENDYSDALRTAAGLGFRWFSPIGLLRFEWGIPLARLQDEQRVVFEFSIGNGF